MNTFLVVFWLANIVDNGCLARLVSCTCTFFDSMQLCKIKDTKVIWTPGMVRNMDSVRITYIKDLSFKYQSLKRQIMCSIITIK